MTEPTLREQLRAALLTEGAAQPEDVDGIVSVALWVLQPTALAAEVDRFHAEGDLRDQITEALRQTCKIHQVTGTCTACDRRLKALMPVVQAALAKVERERDLAIAHDSQPYPTAAAYERACAALWKHRDRADAAERERDEVHAAIAEAHAALDRASTELAAAKVRLESSTATHMEHAKAITDLSAERDEARAAHQRVQDLHARDDSSPYGPWCGVCSTPWPCRTRLAVEPDADLDRPEGT